ncbi:alpha/beta hydrolase fold domain-containing protein [Paenibacillus sp. FSL L8-0436]|uniref:alpha/beta hydrolase fold domain-containing protein n=1 Tax=Paenibacillus sp. FSL L8-0436 TaxID=2954686 RepID=UPI0031585F2F
MRNGLRRKAIRFGTRVLLALTLLCPPLELQALTQVHAETPVPIPPPAEPQPFPVPEGVELYEDVLIGNAGTRPIYTSIAVPKTTPNAPVPVMVYIHGGGWNHGDRKQALASICSYVTKRGYIGVSLDYRLTPEAPFPAQIQDVKLAIRYLRAHAAEYHLDPNRIGVWGTSAGGHLASLLGTTGQITSGDTITLDTGHVVNVPDLGGNGGWQQYSDQVQAVVDMYGPADFTTNFANSYKSVKALLGGNNAFSVPDQARLAMPGTYASPDDPPFFIRHGDADATIPYTDSVTFANQLKNAGVKVVDVKIVPKQGHGFTGEAAEQASAEAWAFLDQYVKNRITITPPSDVASIPNFTPGPPREPVPFTAPGLTEADGTVHPVHSPHVTTGRVLNVLNYHADPADNDADDGLAIQAAINSAQPGDEVYLPSGVYNLNSTLDTLVNLKLKSGVNLRGENQSATILKTSLNKVKNSSLMKVSGQHDLSISNLTLTSTWKGVYRTDHKVNNPDAGGPDSMITIANFGGLPSYNITVDGVTVEKYSRMGMRIDNSRDIVVRRSTFRNATDVGPGGAGYGVSIQGIAKQDRNGYDNDTLWNVVEDSRFEGPYLRHGALIQFVAHNNVLRDNQFTNTKLDAIDLHGELEYLNEIYGNVISDIPYGAAVGLGNTGGTAPSNHSKTGPRNYIHDNTIRNTREGINVTMGTPDTVIERNLIENTSGIEDAKGIRILNGPGTIIKENVIRNNTSSNYWAVSLEHDPGDSKANNIGEGDPQNVQLIGNSLTGNTNGIRLLAGTGITLQGNLVDSVSLNYFKSEHVVVEGWPLNNEANP